MPGATHNGNVTVTVTLSAATRQRAGFGSVMLLVLKSENSLGGDRVLSFESYADAQSARTSTYISAETLEAARVAFSQRPKPAKFKVGYVDDDAAVVAVKASHTFGGLSNGAGFDSVLEAHTAGEDGNDITVELVGDSSGAVSITVVGTVVTIHFQPTVSTVTNVQTAIAALSGADDIIDVKTTGTGATVLAATAGQMSPVNLSGGVDAVSDETYSDALTAIIAEDDDFYGVCIQSRVAADLTAFGATIEAAEKMMIFVAQNASSSWLNSGLPAGITGDRERTAYCYHDTDSEWMDVAMAVNRLVWDPDKTSAPWNGMDLAEVAAYATGLTSTQRSAAFTNYVNLGLPMGTGDFVIDQGVNSAGRPIYEQLSADWFATRLPERVNALKLARSNRGQKIPVTPEGQTAVLAELQAQYAIAVRVGHINLPDEADEPIVAEDITDDDRTARELRFTVLAEIGVDARLFTFDCNFSTTSISG